MINTLITNTLLFLHTEQKKSLEKFLLKNSLEKFPRKIP